MILIDHRESESLKNHDWGFENRVSTDMKVGDYLIERQIIVERKEINDFVKSMEQRLWEQLVDLEDALASDKNDITTAVLFIHGTVADLNSFNMNKRKIDAIYGAISRVVTSYDVTVIWVREESQFIKQITKFHDKAGTDGTKVKPHLTKRNFRDNRIDVLYGIEGIGFETATDLLDHFPTLKDIATATQAEMQKVPGIGPKTAEKIHGVFNDDN
ncbi:MAG: ERCC4 domain-containing protein [Halopenitus sp.]